MASIIESKFRKSGGITREKIEDLVKKKQIKESIRLECKEIDESQNKLNDDIKENAVIKPLVAFLNSNLGQGVLCLGIKAYKNVADKTMPIDVNIIKDEEQLSDIILDNIKSTPSFHHKPQLTIEKINWRNRNIFLIEIEKIDKFCVYYSNITGNAYVREHDKSNKLSPPRLLELISKNNLPHVFLNFGEFNRFRENFEFDIVFLNEGYKPGKNVKSLFFVCPDNNLLLDEGGVLFEIKSFYGHINARGYNLKSQYKKNLENLGFYNEISSCNKIFTYETVQKSEIVIYPAVPSFLGSLQVNTKNDFTMTIFALNYENEILTTQKILISHKDGKLMVEDMDKEVRPYINL